MDISAFNKKAAKSFNQQKSLIKKVLSGKSAQCPECETQLQLLPGANGFKVCCNKGCTDIELEANTIK
jgi:hypothetical protein